MVLDSENERFSPLAQELAFFLGEPTHWIEKQLTSGYHQGSALSGNMTYQQTVCPTAAGSINQNCPSKGFHPSDSDFHPSGSQTGTGHTMEDHRLNIGYTWQQSLL